MVLKSANAVDTKLAGAPKTRPIPFACCLQDADSPLPFAAISTRRYPFCYIRVTHVIHLSLANIVKSDINFSKISSYLGAQSEQGASILNPIVLAS